MDKTEIEKRRSGRKSSCRLGGSSWLAVLSACCACCCMRPRHYHIQQNVTEDQKIGVIMTFTYTQVSLIAFVNRIE